MQRFATHVIVFATLLALLPAAARGGLVVDHQPFPTGGPASDTAFVDPLSGQQWQLLADQVPVLASDAPIERIVWWGFYGSLSNPRVEAPPESELMRIRFYASDPFTQLPGALEHEFTVANPLREATGREIAAGPRPDEFRFEVELTEPVTLLAGQAYWIEIAQVGDAASFFSWEFSLSESDGFAFDNEITQGWRQTQAITADLAYQLWAVPEPSFGLLLPFVFVVSRRTRGR